MLEFLLRFSRLSLLMLWWYQKTSLTLCSPPSRPDVEISSLVSNPRGTGSAQPVHTPPEIQVAPLLAPSPSPTCAAVEGQLRGGVEFLDEELGEGDPLVCL